MQIWELTSLDLFSLGMTIKGAWIYTKLPPTSDLQSSLDTVLQPYPLLLGNYNAKLKAVVWSGMEKGIELTELDRREHSVNEDIYTLVPEFDISGFKKGKTRALEAYRIKLGDGDAIVLQGAHALMDGSTFYRIARDWGKTASGMHIDTMKVDQSLISNMHALTKEQTLARVQKLGWSKIRFKSLLRMMFNLAAMKKINETYTIEVSQNELQRMQNENGAGANAILCHLAVSKLLEKFPTKRNYTIIEVADLRGRVSVVPNNFFGNFSQALVVGEFDRKATATDIQNRASAILRDSEALRENVQLSICASGYGLPYFLFDAGDMNSRDPKLFYVNNQLKFKACEIDFGTGLPLRAQQAMLPDMIKLWQEKPGGPIQIIYGGFAAETMRIH